MCPSPPAPWPRVLLPRLGLLSSEKHGFRTITTSQARTYSPLPLLLVGLSRSSRRSLRLPRTPYVRLIAYSSAIAYCLLPIVSAPLACICRPLIRGFWFSHIIRFPPPPHHLAYPQCITHLSRVLGISPPTVSLLLCFASGCRALLLFAGIMKRIIKGRVFISVWRVCVCVLRNGERAHGAPTRMH